MITTYVLVGTAAAAAAAHTFLPDHWLSYVLAVRARQMSHGRAVVMAGAGAITPLFSTVLIGLVFALAGESAAARNTWGMDRLIELVVVGLGLYFLWRGWYGQGQRHEHREVGYSQMHDHLPEGFGHRHNYQEKEHTQYPHPRAGGGLHPGRHPGGAALRGGHSHFSGGKHSGCLFIPSRHYGELISGPLITALGVITLLL